MARRSLDDHAARRHAARHGAVGRGRAGRRRARCSLLVRDGALAAGDGAGRRRLHGRDVALLDEIAETILPETSTPGAKAAKTGAFMALMVTDAYTDANQQVFRDGMRQLDDACRAAHGVAFMQATPAQRLTLLEALDREQKTAMEERACRRGHACPAARRAPRTSRAHYFRMMKELALLGYFTSEIGYTKAMRYVDRRAASIRARRTHREESWADHA